MSAGDQAGNLGLRIKAILHSRGLSQTDLATKTGIDRTELNRLVNGRRHARLEEIGWIAEALGVGIEELVGDLKLPDDLRRALGHFGPLAGRVLRSEGERDKARAQMADLESQLGQERQLWHREREELERKLKRLTADLSRARAQLSREKSAREKGKKGSQAQVSQANLQSRRLAARNEALCREVRRLRDLVTGRGSTSASDVAAAVLTIGLLGGSIKPVGRH